MLSDVENIETEFACVQFPIGFLSLACQNLTYNLHKKYQQYIAYKIFMHNLSYPFSYFNLLYLFISFTEKY